VVWEIYQHCELGDVLLLKSWLMLFQTGQVTWEDPGAILIPQLKWKPHNVEPLPLKKLASVVFLKKDGTYPRVIEAAADDYNGADLFHSDEIVLENVTAQQIRLRILVNISVICSETLKVIGSVVARLLGMEQCSELVSWIPFLR
jgi:hypothetical protein